MHRRRCGAPLQQPQPERHRLGVGAQGRRNGRHLRRARSQRRHSGHHQVGFAGLRLDLLRRFGHLHAEHRHAQDAQRRRLHLLAQQGPRAGQPGPLLDAGESGPDGADGHSGRHGLAVEDLQEVRSDAPAQHLGVGRYGQGEILFERRSDEPGRYPAQHGLQALQHAWERRCQDHAQPHLRNQHERRTHRAQLARTVDLPAVGVLARDAGLLRAAAAQGDL